MGSCLDMLNIAQVPKKVLNISQAGMKAGTPNSSAPAAATAATGNSQEDTSDSCSDTTDPDMPELIPWEPPASEATEVEPPASEATKAKPRHKPRHRRSKVKT